MFDNILKWKLLDGSHKFPGPDGGTCINEAAIVAAGFKYRRISDAHDCPRCFSRPIAQFAIALNDHMPRKLRQELLLPFVTRLAGTRDKPDAEMARAKLIVFRAIREVLPIILARWGLLDQARRCGSSSNFNAAALFTIDRRYVSHALANPVTETAMRFAISAVESLDHQSVVTAVNFAAELINSVASRTLEDRRVFTIGVSILDEAIKLGRQAEPIETALVVERLASIKRQARELAAAQ